MVSEKPGEDAAMVPHLSAEAGRGCYRGRISLLKLARSGVAMEMPAHVQPFREGNLLPRLHIKK